MSTSVEVSSSGMASPVEGEEGDDPRLDKKKKFKPFQKVRNFFRGSSKKRFKPDESVGQKSHSTGALHHQPDSTEDDDEGGFRPKTLGLAGSRSISEDSIFKPDAKESTPGVLENKTVSMEYLVQSELLAKLKSRHSDSGIDEGLPYNPSATLTPHGLMFDTGVKSVPATGKSTSRESEKSLISVDGSDEDLFSSNWKSGVASVKTARSQSLDSLPENQMDTIDFEAVQMRSTSLSNEAAKHRISVKPRTRRISSKMSMRKRERSPAPPQLQDVMEESPTKTQTEENDGTKQAAPQKTVLSTTIPIRPQSDCSVNVIPRSEPRDIPGQPDVTMRHQVKDMARSEPTDIPYGDRQSGEKTRPRSLSPLSTSPVSQSMLQEVKLRKRPVSGKFESEDVKKEAESTGNELAKAFNRAKRISKKFDEEGNVIDINAKPVAKVQEESAVKKQTEVTKPALELKNEPVTSPVKDSPVTPQGSSSMSGVSFVLKKEPLRRGSRTENSRTAISDSKDTPKLTTAGTKITITETPTSVTISNAGSNDKSDNTGTVKEDGAKKENVKLGSPEKLASPREEYKLKRAARSKTLPVSKDILDRTEEVENKVTSNRLGSPPLGGRRTNDYENIELGAKSVSIQSKRSSWAPPSATTAISSEPAWVMRARLKQMEQEKKIADDKVDSAKNVKVEVKGVQQGSVDKLEKPEPEAEVKTVDKLSNEQKSDISKGTVQTGGVKSWAQSYSAKPFEKPTVPSTSKTSIGGFKTSNDKVGVHSVKPPVPATTEQVKSTASVSSAPIVAASTSLVSSANPKQVATTSSKPTSSAFSKPTVTTATSKPAVSAFVKPPVTGASKPNLALTSASSADKLLSQSSKPAVSVPSTLSSDKPLSQSIRLDGKQSGYTGVSGTSNNFSKSLISKTGTSGQKTAQDIKPLPASTVKPPSVSKTDTKDSTSKPISVSSLSKSSSLDNKKADNDLKNTNTATSAVKLSSSGDKSKPAFGGSTKQETSSALPPWKQALNQRKASAGAQQVKIEIIDKAEKAPQKKVEEKPASVKLREKPEKFSDVSASRPSKVLDMVKSFQNLQVT